MCDVCLYTQVCLTSCVYVCLYILFCLCVYICIHVGSCVSLGILGGICARTCVLHVSMCMRASVRECVVCVFVHVRACPCMCMYVCVCMLLAVFVGGNVFACFDVCMYVAVQVCGRVLCACVYTSLYACAHACMCNGGGVRV